MSRNEKKIRDALLKVGCKRTNHKIEYEPIHGPCFEKAGYEGGWSIDDDPVGYSADEVVAHILECPDFYNGKMAKRSLR